MEYFLLIAGFALLIYSGKFLVRASVAIARRLRLSRLLIGLTVVALGTSAPELLVSVSAVLSGHPDIAVYNVIGSNISNIALVLSVAALVLPIAVRPAAITFNWSSMMAVSVIFYLFILDRELTSFEGGVFLALIILFILLSVRRAKYSVLPAGEEAANDMISRSIPLAVLVIIASSAGLAAGAGLLVDNATLIARNFGISERLISVSLLAVGTSIPELATSIIAALRKESDISIGNILGSNIFNILFVLGIAALVRPVAINPAALEFDIFWMLGFAALLFLLMLLKRPWVLTRLKAFLLFLAYFVYLYLIFER
jgi:cation:H+ antiporter